MISRGEGSTDQGLADAGFGTWGPPTGGRCGPHHEHLPAGACHVDLAEYIKDKLPSGLIDQSGSMIGACEGAPRSAAGAAGLASLSAPSSVVSRGSGAQKANIADALPHGFSPGDVPRQAGTRSAVRTVARGAKSTGPSVMRWLLPLLAIGALGLLLWSLLSTATKTERAVPAPGAPAVPAPMTSKARFPMRPTPAPSLRRHLGTHRDAHRR
jgi:hypothetical protein